MLPPLDSPAEAEARAEELDARLDAVRVEDLNEGIDRLLEWAASVGSDMALGVNFAIGVLLSVRDREPAAQGEPTFFQPGHTYTEPGDTTDWRFRCDSITSHPDDGERTALGWRHFRGEWEPYAYGEDDFEIHQIADTFAATEAGEAS
jgi:hypothetical protein